MAKSKRFKEREQRMIDVAQGRIPDRVPICGLIETYALSYSGIPLKEAALSVRTSAQSGVRRSENPLSAALITRICRLADFNYDACYTSYK